MRNASREWIARVAARNAIEIAKAQREGRAVPLSASSANGQYADCQGKEGK